MKTLHYYCSTHPIDEYHEVPFIDDGWAVRGGISLTWSIVRRTIERFASGSPPYVLTVPAEFLAFAFENWDHPVKLVQIVPKPNREDCCAVDTCELQFKDTLIVFHCLRLCPYEPALIP